MSAWIRPKITSPRFKISQSDSSVELEYSIGDETDESEALNLLATTAPAAQIVGGLLLEKVEFEITPTRSHNMWDGLVRYTKRSREREELQEGESAYQFETGGGLIHLTHSLATTKYPPSTAPDYNNAIEFDGETIKGTDIQAPVYNFSETHIVPAANVDGAYKLALFRCTGKVNNSSFKGFAAGECLFLGATGSARGDEAWEINYRFAASENVTGLTIGHITGIEKKGFQFLWVKWSTVADPPSGTTRPYPEGVYVEDVYLTHNFANLGIGT